ncbi:FtsW/RodA/SpoVE family cell cycle protein [Paenibacillus sp. S28]|uniref:FtsW/RodA/SpoVE family cell cycle protein n=1 Tax=Paenibacillus sp. S28 TaxID=2767463 RepID=UPI00190E108D|nr:FtsW/RodA/SpoVE family cell cycle protein [Paenibacillus sp. S28]MBJ9992989.1 rod shape-determining protein RodA [Paenibacillus sp. S28]
MLRKLKQLDFAVILVLLCLMAFSLTSIYSVTAGRPKTDHYSVRMAVYYVIGFAGFLATSLVNYKLLIKYALYVYIFGLMLLLFVLFAGNEYYGARGWLTLPGGLSLQPAELFKLFLVIFLSSLLLRKNRDRSRGLYFWRDVVPMGLLTFVPLMLVMAQNDLGNALCYLLILVGLLWIGGIRYVHALIGFAVAFAAIFGGIQAYIHYHDEAAKLFKSIGREHWIARFDPWLVPDKASRDDSWQTYNAKLAIGSGGLDGKGYMQGTTIQSDGRVPLAFADSIFVQIAEEYGFIGSSALLLLYFILIHRMILIAADCRDRAGPYLITGIITMFIYQIFVNIGAFIGLMPLTGITLPFISYGGTSLVINMVSIGVVMSVRIHGQEEEELLPLQNEPAPATGTGKILRLIRDGFNRN